MSPTAEFVLFAMLVGIGATAVMDAWALLVRLVFGIPSLNYAMVGRWIGHWRHGQYWQANIGQATPVRGEMALGWLVHYLIGIIFAAVLLLVVGPQWLQQPTLLPALSFGVFSVVAPFFILQPAFGAGIAAAKTPQPNSMRWRSLMAHTSFGIGLYLAALLIAYCWRVAILPSS